MNTYRLHRLRLENFRGYRDLDLDLSADVTIIYGRNGIGKTAIFDAIEFLLSGGLGRFARYDPAPSSYLRHVMAGSQRTLARLELQASDQQDPWLQAELLPDQDTFHFTNAPAGGRNDFLYKTLGDPAKLPARQDMRVMGDLIRASVMLSQDSLREFIEAEGADRKPMLANLSGLGFYERCVEKIESVVDIGERKRREAVSIIEELEASQTAIAGQLAAEEQRLSVLPQAEINTRVPTLEEVKGRFEGIGGRWPTSNLPVVEAAEAAQTFCRLRIRELTQRFREIEALRGILPALHEQTQRKSRLITEIAERRRIVAAVLERETLERTELNQKRQERDRAVQAVTAIDAAFGTLRLLEDTLIADHHLLGREMQSVAALEEAKRLRDAAAQGRAAAIKHANELDVNFARLDATARNETARTGKVRNLHNDFVEFRTRREAAGDLTLARQEAEQRRRTAMVEAAQRSASIESLLVQLGQIAHAISESVAARGEIAKLAEIARQRHTGGDCPLCGQDYGSEMALHAAMDRVLATGDATTARLREEEKSKRISLREHEQHLDKLKGEVSSENRNIARIDTLHRELDADLAALLERAQSLHLQSTESTALLAALAAAEQSEAHSKSQCQALNAEIVDFRPVRTETEARLAHAEQAVAAAQTDLSNFTGQRTENIANRNRLLRTLPAFANIDIKDLLERVTSLISSRENERQAARTQAEALSAQLIEREAQQRASAEERQAIGRDISSRELEAADCTARAAEYIGALDAMKISTEGAESEITHELETLRLKLDEANFVTVALRLLEQESRRALIRTQCKRLAGEMDDLRAKMREKREELQRISSAVEQAERWQLLLRPALDGGSPVI